MNRRQAITTLGSLAVLPRFNTTPSWQRGTYGYVDVERHFALTQQGLWLRPHLNGEDVTDRCINGDDREGYVTLYKHRNGAPYIDYGTMECVREVLHGRVEFHISKPWNNGH